jgi:hypothetical protein
LDGRFDDLHATDLAALVRVLIFDAEDAAAYLGVSPFAFHFAVARGRIPFVEYHRHQYFAVGDLQRYAVSREQPARKASLRGRSHATVTWVHPRRN